MIIVRPRHEYGPWLLKEYISGEATVNSLFSDHFQVHHSACPSYLIPRCDRRGQERLQSNYLCATTRMGIELKAVRGHWEHLHMYQFLRVRNYYFSGLAGRILLYLRVIYVYYLMSFTIKTKCNSRSGFDTH